MKLLISISYLQQILRFNTIKKILLCLICSGLILNSGCSSTQHKRYSENFDPKVKKDGISKNEIVSIKSENRTEPRTASKLLADESPPLYGHALNLYYIANDFWLSGDFDSALESLDQAYDLIISVETITATDMQQRYDLRIAIARRIMEIHSSRTIGVEGKQSPIQIPDNRYVQQEIDRFTKKERIFFAKAYRRSGLYMDMILEKLNEAGLPTELAWLPLIQSGFQVKALSSASALGLWQFTPSTGVRFGLRRDRLIDERMDPEKATDAAVAYLTELHRLFGDWPTVIAAYNCGEEWVLRTIKMQNVNYLDNFWDLYTKLPRETAQYVSRFLATVHVIKNMEKYRFDPKDLYSPVPYERVSVERQLDLQSIATATGIDFSNLKNLNPELCYDLLPHERYTLKIPKGNKEKILNITDSGEAE